MYDADYASYLENLREEAKLLELKTPAMDAGHPPDFVVRDSGSKAQYDDGMQRDDPAGKPKFSLMWPKGIPYEEQLMYRVAMHYMHGGEKYGDRNWEKSCTEESLAAHEEALWRHFTKFCAGVEDGEDHAAAIVWNINAVLLTRRNIKLKKPDSVFPENLMPGEEVLLREDLGDGVTMGELKKPPEWAKHSAKCCDGPVYSSLPFTYSDGCGKGAVTSAPLELDPFKSYLFPYVGATTAATGQYHQKQIRAENYQKAQQLFDDWYSKQPFYNSVEER